MICIPISGTTTEAFLVKRTLAAALADIIELRLDGTDGIDLARLLEAPRPPVIVTNRRRDEGGAFAGSEAERVARLVEAARLGADYVDLETATEPALKAALRQACEGSGTKRIASWHDVTGTPPAEILQERFAQAMADAPAIVKLVTLARHPAENLRLLELIPWGQSMGQAITAFCMGDAGVGGRLMAHLMGAAVTYVALDEGEASAPGQLTARRFRDILALLPAAALASAGAPAGAKGVAP